MIERATKMADWLRGTYGFNPKVNAECVRLLKDMVREMEKFKAERDAAIADLKSADLGCQFCRWNGMCELPEDTEDIDCETCTIACMCSTCTRANNKWEWRGAAAGRNCETD